VEASKNSNEGYSPLETYQNLKNTAEKIGLSVTLKEEAHPKLDDNEKANVYLAYYKNQEKLPIETGITLGDGKAKTFLERINPQTNEMTFEADASKSYTAEKQWQADALKSAVQKHYQNIAFDLTEKMLEDMDRHTYERYKKDSVSEKNIERGGRNYRYLTYPRSAESSGADIVINSTHKTLSSFTQSAVLNVMTDRVDERNIFDKLQLVQSTSPSYILMLSLDINADIIEKHGDEVFANWKNNVKRFYEQMAKIPEVTVVEDENLDWTKINLSLEKMGIDGGTFEKLLTDRGIDAELAAGNIVMALTGIGNSLEDYGKLLHAVKDIVWSIKERRKSKLRENVDYNSCESSVCDMDIRRRRSEIDADERKETCGDEKSTSDEQLNKTGCKGDESMIKFSVEDSDCISVDNGFSIPKPGDYMGTEGESAEVYLRDSMGCISKDAIIPYPPGIPFVCPGV